MQGSEDVGTNVPALGYHSLTWGLRDCVFLVGGEGGGGEGGRGGRGGGGGGIVWDLSFRVWCQ